MDSKLLVNGDVIDGEGAIPSTKAVVIPKRH